MIITFRHVGIAMMYIGTCAVAAGFLYVANTMKDEHDRTTKKLKDLEYYQAKYKTRLGWTGLVNQPDGIKYDILSVDGGKSWYNQEQLKSGEIRLTPVDPVVLKSIKATELLMSGTQLTVDQLREAGFLVEYKP